MKIAFSLAECQPQKDTAVALGFFDGVHLGHVEVIRTAVSYKQASLAPCVFTFTAGRTAPAGKKGSNRLISEHEKYALLKELGVQYVAAPDFSEFMELSPEGFVRDILVSVLRAKAVCCGENFHFGKNAAGDIHELARLCELYHIELRVCPAVMLRGEVVSSTRIRECIRRGDVQAAALLLGRPYSLTAHVVQGRRLGRRLRFPTINQHFPEDFELPRFGVYASFVWAEGRWHAAVTSVGVKPTVGSDRPLAETHIFDYDADLYDRTVRVALLQFLRAEQKFDTIEALRAQIARDVQTARAACKALGAPESPKQPNAAAL